LSNPYLSALIAVRNYDPTCDNVTQDDKVREMPETIVDVWKLLRPVNREMLIEWVRTFHAEDAEELREALLWRLREGAFAPSPYPPFNAGKWRKDSYD